MTRLFVKVQHFKRKTVFHLQKNLPWWERLLRLTVGAVLVAAALALQLEHITLWLAIAAAATLALTAFVGFCPACAMFGRRPVRKAP